MSVVATPRKCADCGSEHLGVVPCGLTWIERMRSVDIHGEATPTKTKRAYYDREPVRAQFGADAKEKMLDDTGGIGYVRKDRTGTWRHRNRKTGEVESLSPKQAGFLLGEDRQL